MSRSELDVKNEPAHGELAASYAIASIGGHFDAKAPNNKFPYGYHRAVSVAALVIGADILRDGWAQLRIAVADIIEREPTTLKGKLSDLWSRIAERLQGPAWITDAAVRMREHGHVLFGEAFVVPRHGGDLPENIRKAVHEAKCIDWRIGNIVITPLPELDRDS